MEDNRRPPPPTTVALPGRPWFRLASQVRLDQPTQPSSSPPPPPPQPNPPRLTASTPSPEAIPATPSPESPKVIRPTSRTPPPSPKPTSADRLRQGTSDDPPVDEKHSFPEPPPPPARTSPPPETVQLAGQTPEKNQVKSDEPKAVQPEKKVSSLPARRKAHLTELPVDGTERITLTGDNTGAHMDLTGSEGSSKNSGFNGISRRVGDKEGEKEDILVATPTRVVVNSNVQGVNNSIVFNSHCCHGNPGVHVVLSKARGRRSEAAVVRPEGKLAGDGGDGDEEKE